MSATTQAGSLFYGYLLVASTVLLCAVTGCHSPPPATEAEPIIPPSMVQATPGTIVHVDAARRFCVLENGDPLSPGMEVQVIRQGREVARLTVTGPARYPFTAADIRQGLPRLGDRVLLLQNR